MNLRFFIDRPVFSGVISVVIVLLGMISMFSLPVEQYPDIAPPTINVSATYPGANAETVQKAVITPLEAGTGKDAYKVNFTKASDGTYTAQIYWLADPYEPDGSISLDVKNPDKSLRSTPMSQVVLIKGLKYNAEKKRWDGGKIYDPTRGIRVSVDCHFEGAKALKLHGNVLGIGETVTWNRIAE